MSDKTGAHPAFIDYDGVERLTQLLTLAAMRKRVVMYAQAVAACQGGELEQVLRGNVQPDKMRAPGPDDMLNIITHVTQAYKAKGWPPLSILITKDGKTVSQGFWATTPVGDLSTVQERTKRDIELAWRQECYAYFDSVSSMNTGLVAVNGKYWRVIKNSFLRHPRLLSTVQAFVHTGGVDGRSMSETQVDALMRSAIEFNPELTEVLNYDANVFPAPKEATVIERTLVLPVNTTEVGVVSRLGLNPGNVLPDAVLTAVGFEVVGVLDVNMQHMACTFTKVIQPEAGIWKYDGELTDVPAKGTVNKIGVLFMPHKMSYSAFTPNPDITHVLVTVKVQVD